MSIAKMATGTLLKVGDGGGPENFTVVPEVMRVNAPDVRVDLVDVSSHDSSGGFREYVCGFKDGESVTAELNWVPSNAVHISLRVDAYAATKRNFKIAFNDTSDHVCSYSGYIMGYAPQSNAGDAMRSTINIKVTGMPTWGNT